MVSAIVVGRAEPLGRLRQLIEQSCAGRGQVVVLAGEAGIGKTRLVAEALSQAAQAGAQVLEGHCFEQDQALPFAPLVDLLRACLGPQPPARPDAALAQALRTAGPSLVRLLPELAGHLPHPAPVPAGPPEEEKGRLYYALTHFLTQLPARRPLLLVVEDLHWSDQASLDYLLHLARRAAQHPLLLLLTYRNDEVPPGLLQFLASLDRERLAAEITLARLSGAETAAMLRALLGAQFDLSPAWVDFVCGLTEGNPFFIEEIAKAVTTAAQGPRASSPPSEVSIPRTVRAAVQQRTDMLSAPARQLLTLAAGVGRRFDFRLLQALAGMDEATMLTQLKQLHAAQLIVEESADRYAFRHALTREAVYATLLRRERKALHQTVGETLERLWAGQLEAVLADLARHFSLAESWEKALAYSQRAGERALNVYAPHEAIEHFSSALEAARQMARPAPAELLRLRGRANDTAGRFEAARADFEGALAAAREAKDSAGEWQALHELGQLWASRDYTQTGKYYRDALALARQVGDPAMVGHSLNRLGNWQANMDLPGEALRQHQEAQQLFQALNDRRGLGETLDLLGMASQLASDTIQSYQAYEQAIRLWRELGDPWGQATSLASVALCAATSFKDLTVAAVTLPEAVRAAEEGLRLAREIGWRAGEAYALINLAVTLGPMGEYSRALEAARTALRLAEEIEHRQWTAGAHAVLGLLYLDVLALDAARAHLERALPLAREIGSRVWLGVTTASLARTCTAQGELGRAESLLQSGLASDALMQTQGQRLGWYARAELALARGQTAAALDIAGRLLASAGAANGAPTIPRLGLLRGEALTALGEAEAAEATLRSAQAAAADQGLRPLAWRIHAALSKLYKRLGKPEAAEAEATAARELVLVLAQGLPDEGLRRGLAQRATAALPHPPAPSPARMEKAKFGGLTMREREVARLVAQGKSNREIAAELVVGVRTVEAHVTRTLNKLGFSSRAQIAAWAVEKGLAGPRPDGAA